MKRLRLLIGALIAVFSVFYGVSGFLKAERLARTNETLAIIILTASNHRGKVTDLIDHSLFIQEVHNKFPKIPYADDAILDAWMHPITVNVGIEGNMLHIRAISSGPDGIHGTEDDIIKEDKFKID